MSMRVLLIVPKRPGRHRGDERSKNHVGPHYVCVCRELKQPGRDYQPNPKHQAQPLFPLSKCRQSGNGQSGATNVPVTIFRNVDGNFNALPKTSATAVGNGTLSFSDCANGAFTYTFSDGSNRTGTIPLTRLLPNVTCAAGAAPGTNADFALSGNWFDPATEGQGFVFELNPNAPFFFATWYTYSPTGEGAGSTGQRWFTGQGSYTPGSRSMTVPLFATTGGIFDLPSTPKPSTDQVGTATVMFTSCTSAQIQFNFTAGTTAGRMGTILLSRIASVPPGCTQAAAPSPMMPGYPGYGPM